MQKLKLLGLIYKYEPDPPIWWVKPCYNRDDYFYNSKYMFDDYYYFQEKFLAPHAFIKGIFTSCRSPYLTCNIPLYKADLVANYYDVAPVKIRSYLRYHDRLFYFFLTPMRYTFYALKFVRTLWHECNKKREVRMYERRFNHYYTEDIRLQIIYTLQCNHIREWYYLEVKSIRRLLRRYYQLFRCSMEIRWERYAIFDRELDWREWSYRRMRWKALIWQHLMNGYGNMREWYIRKDLPITLAKTRTIRYELRQKHEKRRFRRYLRVYTYHIWEIIIF